MKDINNFLGISAKNAQKSIVRVQADAGSSGSFDSGQIRNWTTVLDKLGNDIQYTHDTIMGDYFTIVTPGLYYISHNDTAGLANFSSYILKNTPRSKGISVGTADYPNILSFIYHATANDSIKHSCMAWLNQGDIITVAVNPANVGANVAAQQFTIIKILGT